MSRQTNRTTLKDLAEQLNLTVTTVSRILLGQARKYRLSKETAEKVLAAAKAANYRPDQTARALRTQKTYTIGLIVPDITDSFFSSIARIIENEARAKGYATLLSDSNESTSVEIECVDLLEYRNIDGLIICPVGQTSDHIEELYEKNAAIVLINRYFQDTNIPFVAPDHYRGAFDAVSYLIESGHRKIAYIQGSTDSISSQQCLKGYLSALESKNLKVEEHLIKGNGFSLENGYNSMKLLLEQSCMPTAVFAQSNLIALGAYRLIKEGVYKIPDDISMIAFDDPQHADLLSPPLTCIRQPSQEIGQIAVRLLMDQMEHSRPQTPERVLLVPALVHRNSVQRLAP